MTCCTINPVTATPHPMHTFIISSTSSGLSVRKCLSGCFSDECRRAQSDLPDPGGGERGKG
jgi:hypothetical protein